MTRAVTEPSRHGPTGFTPVAMLGMCMSFMVIGALQALYGPAVPSMQGRYDISSGQVGLALSIHFVGALLGVLCTPRLRPIGNRRFLVISMVTIVVGCLGFASAPSWTLALVAAFVAGVGFGWIDVGVNELFLEYYGTGATGKLNLLHGNFGAGAVLAPLLVGALPGDWYFLAFVVCGFMSLIVLTTVKGVSGGPQQASSTAAVRWAAIGRMTGLFMIFFVLHVGVESGVGGWETSHLVSLGWAAGPAAMATSVFWLAMTGVRFAISPVARFFSTQRILLTSLVVMVVGLLVAHWAPAAPVGYLLAGLGVGPLFPTGLVWLTEKLPGVPGVTSYVIAVSMIGGVLPSAVGASVEQWGPGVIPTVLTVMAVGCLSVAVVIKVLPALRTSQPSEAETAGAVDRASS